MPTSIQLRQTADAVITAVNGCQKHQQPAVRSACLTRGMQVPDHVACVHTRSLSAVQCCSVMVQNVQAPPETVWSILHRFENPQAYKQFVRSCHVVHGDGRQAGSIREVQVVSGLPAAFSTERLEILDDQCHVISFSIVGGDHRLKNYRSVTTVHESPEGEGTVVVESYVVDVPAGNTKEETCSFIDTIVRCNLHSLAQLAENITANNHQIKPT